MGGRGWSFYETPVMTNPGISFNKSIQNKATGGGLPYLAMSAKNHSENIVRIRVIFYGRVQGVGFRYSVRGFAQKFPVVGYVRNQSDGTVELETEGALEAVRFFLDDIHEFFAGNIERHEESDRPVTDAEDRFTIRH